ncbi:MAG: LPS assembly lipoprotein LptE [Myxococcota bacterium]
MRGPGSSSCFILASLLVLTLSACGYRSTLAGGGGGSGREGRSESDRPRIAIVALRSDSPEPWLDRIVTDSLRREVGSRARLRLTNEPASAELRVRGRIRPLETTSRSFSSFVAALEYSLTLVLDLEVQLAGGDVIKLDSKMLSETESYLASPDIEVTRSNRLEALRHLSDQLASRVADTIELIDRPVPANREGAGG